MNHAFHTETIEGLTVKFIYDTDADAPWDSSEGHGSVRMSRHAHCHSGIGYSDKTPGERPLNSPDRNQHQYYYDWQAATKSARVDGWNAAPYDAPNRVQRAVQADFDFLRGYINDDWCYVGVVIEDTDGNTLDSLWGVETFKGYHIEQAREMVAACWETKRDVWRKALHEARERKYWALRGVETVA